MYLHRRDYLHDKKSALFSKGSVLEAAGKKNTQEYRELAAELELVAAEFNDLVDADYAASQFENDSDVKSLDGGESAAVRRLENKASLQGYAKTVLSGQGIQAHSAEGELNDHLGITDPDGLPLRMLAPNRFYATTTDTDGAVDQRTWLDRLFAETCAMHLGINFESVMPGTVGYPITTAGAAAAQRGRSEAASDAAWTVGVTELKPTRNTVRVVISDEDYFRLPGLEAALRRDMAMALTEGIDKAVFLGDSGANENRADIVGLQGITAAATGLVESTLTQANKAKAPNTLALFANFIDGVHASSMGDLNVVATVGANTLWLSTVLTGGEPVSLAEYLMRNGMSWKVRGGIETATASGDFGAFISKRRGLMGASAAPVWENARLIRDIYSGASKGETALTLSTFWNFGLIRASNFARLKFGA